MNLMRLAYHYLHVKMIDLTKVCMLFDEPLTQPFQMLLLKKWWRNWINLVWDWCEWQSAV